MATSTAQRTGIWIIAIAMTLGTVVGFLAMILAPQNEAVDNAKAEEEYKRQIAQICKQQAADKEKLKPLEGYKATAFKASNVKELKREVLVQGKGKKLTRTSTISANYFGWQSDGTIFDSTNKNGKAKPVDFSLSSVIPGWTEGLTGVKVGSVVRLTIPADKAYGDTQDYTCNPTGPLKFVVEIKSIKETETNE